MQWNKWSQFFSHQSQLLFDDCDGGMPSLMKPTGKEWSDPLCKLEEANCEEIEAAIITFCKMEEWPKMSNSATILLRERLMFACMFATQAQFIANKWKFGPPERRRSRAEIIQWFLINAWEQFGFEQLMNNIRVVPHPSSHKKEATFGQN